MKGSADSTRIPPLKVGMGNSTRLVVKRRGKKQKQKPACTWCGLFGPLGGHAADDCRRENR